MGSFIEKVALGKTTYMDAVEAHAEVVNVNSGTVVGILVMRWHWPDYVLRYRNVREFFRANSPIHESAREVLRMGGSTL